MRVFIGEPGMGWLRHVQCLVDGEDVTRYCYGVDEELGIAYCYRHYDDGRIAAEAGSPIKCQLQGRIQLQPAEGLSPQQRQQTAWAIAGERDYQRGEHYRKQIEQDAQRYDVRLLVEAEPLPKHRCGWCCGETVDDSRGNCAACGGPRVEAVAVALPDLRLLTREEVRTALRIPMSQELLDDAVVDIQATVEAGSLQAELRAFERSLTEMEQTISACKEPMQRGYFTLSYSFAALFSKLMQAMVNIWDYLLRLEIFGRLV